MSLLQLLSCRKLEEFSFHEPEKEKTLSTGAITTSVDFPHDHVMGKFEEWGDFTFEKMIEKFPFVDLQLPLSQICKVVVSGRFIANKNSNLSRP